MRVKQFMVKTVNRSGDRVESSKRKKNNNGVRSQRNPIKNPQLLGGGGAWTGPTFKRAGGGYYPSSMRETTTSGKKDVESTLENGLRKKKGRDGCTRSCERGKTKLHKGGGLGANRKVVPGNKSRRKRTSRRGGGEAAGKQGVGGKLAHFIKKSLEDSSPYEVLAVKQRGGHGRVIYRASKVDQHQASFTKNPVKDTKS